MRYGHIKLGKQDEKPEFDDLAYFTMLFSAGVAVGLFFYGVAEPLEHRSGNWLAEAGKSQDEVDQWAINITMYHWGFAGWYVDSYAFVKNPRIVQHGRISHITFVSSTIARSPYLVVGIAAGLAAYRFDMPMTVRSTLYELLGPVSITSRTN